ncbi:hypothetical protein BGX33_009871 [Mortierella sp. NVP41]|nr:hypothetical protein BGX33_009871 [Mortierella sp. NVP41]
MLINWYAASRHNQFGSNIYFLEAAALFLMPAGNAINAAIFSYCADCTSKGQRSLLIGYVSTSMALGNIIGSVIGGHLTRVTGDFTVSLRISLILTALLAVYLSIVPESLRTKPVPLPFLSRTSDDASDHGVSSPTRMSRWSIWRLVSLVKEATSMICDPILHFLPGRVPRSVNMATPAVPAIILLVHFLSMIGNYGVNSLFYSMTEQLFKWNAYEDGIYAAFISFCFVFAFFGFFPAMQSVYKAFEARKDISEALQSLVDPQDITSSSDTPDQPLRGIKAVKMDMFFILAGLILMTFSFLILVR